MRWCHDCHSPCPGHDADGYCLLADRVNDLRLKPKGEPMTVPAPAFDYQAFLAGKRVNAPAVGFEVKLVELNRDLFDWQKDIVRWALRRGRAAIFADCGLGKTAMQLEWADHVYRRTLKPVLILAPLAVAHQTQREGTKFGIPVTICRSQADVQPGVNVANYEMLEHFDATAFGGIILDESSILKTFMGKTKRLIIERFAETPYKLACTATPAPNDHLELGNHAEFLGVMPSNEMISRWFINDTMQAGSYRLKGHAEVDFWRWVSSWAVSIAKPSDLGYPDSGFDLPELEIITHVVDVDITEDAGDQLFRSPSLSSTNLHVEKRRTIGERAAQIADLVENTPGSWVIWCDTNYEAEELLRRIPEAVEVRGNDSLALKETRISAFSKAEIRVLVTKPSICGFGMNWQHCSQMAFVGLSYSFEQFYQAVRRCHRFGQQDPVAAHVVIAETELPILETQNRKRLEHERMKTAMVAAMRETQLDGESRRRGLMPVESDVARGRDWTLYLGDCCEAVKQIEDESVGFHLFSPPFSNLYIYSDSVADMGNAADDEEFFRHFKFLIPELLRVTMPGRLCAVHCKDLPLYRGRDGAAGLKDFPGMIRQAFEECGWVFHSRVTIWKCPVIEMQRTKNHGLLYKNLLRDSCGSRQGMAEYLMVFRNWKDPERWVPVPHERDDFPLSQWQEWASPVWMDIRQTDVLNVQQAREDRDEKHICPLQLDLIERAITLWSNPGDLVASSFAGIGSELYQAVRLNRRAVGFELKRAYWRQAQRNLLRAENESSQLSLADLMAVA